MTAVTEVSSRTWPTGEAAYEITVVRNPEVGFVPPRVEDVPQDIRDALKTWLENAS